MSDTISRAKAIDGKICIRRSNGVEIYDDYVVPVEYLEQLPPAQLGANLAEVGTDCISRQAAIEDVKSWEAVDEREKHLQKDVIEWLKEFPPAQPEIIRCKDCKHWIPYDWMFSEVWQSKNIADYPEDEIGCNYCDMAMKANDFCSRGERRTDE